MHRRAGCIIRAKLLNKISAALARDKELELNARHMAWRRVVTASIAAGITCPALSASLAYYDQYRRESLPANLVQAQRDFFGGHTYERTDQDGTFHTAWTAAHKDIGDLSGRTKGEM